LQLSVYRIVQEALTNVVKHAGRASTHVDVSCDGSLVVAVSNARGGAPDVPSSSGGHGLLGLAERVSVLGGTLRTGATNDGGFRLVAEIPLTAEVR
jgi:signal transduction histidine kinase